MAQAYCSNCGAKLSRDAKFCGSCGSIVARDSLGATDPALSTASSEDGTVADATSGPLIDPQPAADPLSRSSRKFILIGGIAATLLLALLVFQIALSGSRSSEVVRNQPAVASGGTSNSQAPGGATSNTASATPTAPSQIPLTREYLIGRWAYDSCNPDNEVSMILRADGTANQGDRWELSGNRVNMATFYNRDSMAVEIIDQNHMRFGLSAAAMMRCPTEATATPQRPTNAVRLTRAYLIGNWSVNTCGQPALMLQPDGTTNNPEERGTGYWSLNGNGLEVTDRFRRNPETFTVEVIDQERMRLSGEELPFFRC